VTTGRVGTGDGLSEGDVHVWTIDLDCPPKRRRAAAGARSREILATYLSCRPRDVRIGRSGNGKPTLDRGISDGLSYSLSHSDSRVLVAVAAARRIGVDLERLRPVRDVHALASRFFAANEAKAIASLGGAESLVGFFRVWVRKEAYLKGLGGSVPAGLRRFRVSVGPAAEASILSTELEPTPSAFAIRDLDLASGYAGAIAVEGGLRRIRRMSL